MNKLIRCLLNFYTNHQLAYDIEDAYCRGYAKGYLAALDDENTEWVDLDEVLDISPGGTDADD